MPTHPLVVHLPIALAVLMPVIGAGLLLAWWRGWLPRRTWLIAVIFQAMLVGSTFVALQSGESEEDRVEKVVASEDPIEDHEHAAKRFFWVTIGVLGLFGAVVFLGDKVALAVAGVAVAGTLAVTLLGYQVGHSGAALVYEHGAAQAYTSAAAAIPTADERKHDKRKHDKRKHRKRHHDDD